MELQPIKLPTEISDLFSLNKKVSGNVVIKGIGEIDFSTIKETTAKKVIEKTGDKYLVAKTKSPAQSTTVPKP